MNLDEGSYQLSHMYDRFLDTMAGHRVKIQLTTVSSDEGLTYERGRNVKSFFSFILVLQYK